MSTVSVCSPSSSTVQGWAWAMGPSLWLQEDLDPGDWATWPLCDTAGSRRVGGCSLSSEKAHCCSEQLSVPVDAHQKGHLWGHATAPKLAVSLGPVAPDSTTILSPKCLRMDGGIEMVGNGRLPEDPPTPGRWWTLKPTLLPVTSR